MPVVRFSLSEEYYQKLENEAKGTNMSIQDYIRYKLFNELTIFNVEEAVRRIQEGNFENKEFTLPDVYGEEWTMTREDGAGVFGKYFYNHIMDNPELGIRYIPERTINRRAVYTYKKID